MFVRVFEALEYVWTPFLALSCFTAECKASPSVAARAKDGCVAFFSRCNSRSVNPSQLVILSHCWAQSRFQFKSSRPRPQPGLVPSLLPAAIFKGTRQLKTAARSGLRLVNPGKREGLACWTPPGRVIYIRRDSVALSDLV